MILIDREVQLKELCKSDEIVYLLNSSVLAWENIKSITKFNSQELLIYLIRTCIIGINSSKLKKSVIFLRVSAFVEWYRYEGFQLLFLILKFPIIIKTLLKFIFVSFRYFKEDWWSFK